MYLYIFYIALMLRRLILVIIVLALSFGIYRLVDKDWATKLWNKITFQAPTTGDALSGTNDLVVVSWSYEGIMDLSGNIDTGVSASGTNSFDELTTVSSTGDIESTWEIKITSTWTVTPNIPIETTKPATVTTPKTTTTPSKSKDILNELFK